MYFNETYKFPWANGSFYRIPSIVTASDGTAFAFCNDRKNNPMDNAEEITLVVSRKKPGGDWEPEVTIAGCKGWACYIGSAVYDPIGNTVMCTFGRVAVTTDEWKEYTDEERREIEERAEKKALESGIKPGEFIMYSTDGGDTWHETERNTTPARVVHTDGSEYTVVSGCHGSSHGIMLTKGEHRGRLICPSRFSIGSYSSHDEIRFHVYNNAIWSDDRGKTWQTSQPVQIGTGEGTLIERGDGSLLYNSRAYYHDGKRRTAVSRDGGETWGEFSVDDTLFEDTFQGCNASFLRVEREKLKDADKYLPTDADALTLFVNPFADKRENITVHISFDDGKIWSAKKTVWSGDGGYSSLDYDSVGGIFHLMYEKVEKNPNRICVVLAEFDIDWLFR